MVKNDKGWNSLACQVQLASGEDFEKALVEFWAIPAIRSYCRGRGIPADHPAVVCELKRTKNGNRNSVSIRPHEASPIKESPTW